MSDLATWLRAQLDEDAVVAAAELFPHRIKRGQVEVEAKRRILDLWAKEDRERSDCAECESRAWLMDDVIANLALPYADRPGYDEAWRP